MSKSNKTTPNVPTLRFKKYDTNWDRKKLSDYVKKITRKNSNNVIKNVICNSAQNGLIPQLDFFDKEIANNENTASYYIISNGDFVYNPRKSLSAPYGPVNIYKYDSDGIVSPLYLCFSVDDCINKSFLLQRFKSPCWYRYIYLNGDSGARHDRVSIKDEVFLSQPINLPNAEEQAVIAEFLEKIDERISVQNKIISKYETLIKGIRHRIFGSICGEKQSSLGGFLEEYSEKNVANNLQSVAVGKYGIRKREEIYSKELSADYSKNKVIRKNTLIIGMGSTQIDIGILTTDDCYCVSPAYTTYRIKGVNSFYLQEYLIELNPLLSIRYMITSARQGKAVNKEDLMKHLMTIHSENEQKEICQCFENLYSRLQIEKEMLSALQKQKAFLLQSMFI